MNLEDLVFKAGETSHQPPPPDGGIPRQWLPGWIRWPLRLFFLPFVLLDLAMQRCARLLLPPPYKQVGKCKRRGNCCYYIMLRRPKGPLGPIFSFWSTQINGFYPRDDEIYEYEKHRVQVMGCRYLQADRSCKHHKLRPMVCRKWPVIEHFGLPRIIKGCGFQAVSKKTGEPLKILEEDPS